jgi:ATP-dependent Clp protease ATP-binding subunit ClpA
MCICRWQDELEEALKYKNAVIICGNIRDKYLYENPYVDGEICLVDLYDYLSRKLGGCSSRLISYDPISGERALADSHEDISDPPSERDFDEARAELVGTRGVESRERATSESTADRDLERINRALYESECITYVINFADKITPQKAETEEDMKRVLRLEKMTQGMNPSNRLVLVYLLRDQIPYELYLNQPKAMVVEIPLPDRKQLEVLFKEVYRMSEHDVEQARNIADGLLMIEVDQIISVLEDGFDAKVFEDRVRLYRYGEEESPWNEISLDRINHAFDVFTEEIQGQDEAVQSVINVIIRARADIQRKTGGNPRSPRGKLFFAGPTGVGKTLTAKILAQFLFGSKEAFLRFDMSEYGQDHQVSRLTGAPPGYIGYEEGGTLTNAIKKRPFSIVLFDEIEKAHAKVFDIFLQILEDGRLTDSRGETVYFSEAVILFTSNLGTRSKDITGTPIDEKERLKELLKRTDIESIREHFTRAVEDFFQLELSRPELLNRIGRENIVVFNHIWTDETVRAMLDRNLLQVQEEFNRSYAHSSPSLSLEIAEAEVREFLFKLIIQDITVSGGRSVDRVINQRIRDKLAWCTLKAEFDGMDSAVIWVRVDGEELQFELV